MPKGRRVFTPQTIDIEISGIFRPPAANLIHNARSEVFILQSPLLYTGGSEIPTNNYLMRRGNISGTREIRKIYILTRECQNRRAR